MDREKTTLTTPAGKELVLKAWLTAAERNKFRAVFVGGAKYEVDPGSKTARVESVDPSVADTAERTVIDVAVISYDGKTEGIADALLNGPAEEYDYVVTEAGKLIKGNFLTGK